MRVYTASKLEHAEKWKSLRQFMASIVWTARWVTHYAGRVPDHEPFTTIGWVHDIEDVMSSDVVMVYAEKDEVLRGALVEAGAALACGKWVIVIDPDSNPTFGTWQFHPMCMRCKSLDEAKVLLNLLATNYNRQLPE